MLNTINPGHVRRLDAEKIDRLAIFIYHHEACIVCLICRAFRVVDLLEPAGLTLFACIIPLVWFNSLHSAVLEVY